MIIINKEKVFEAVSFIASLFIVFLMIFGRNFTGIYLFGFRIGELIIGALVFLSFFFIAYALTKKNRVFSFNTKNISLAFVSVVLFFFVSLFINNGNLVNTYSFKTSSYIWTIAIVFLILIFNLEKYLINKYILIVLPIVYFLNAIYFPNIFINFFTQNSDKFDFHKASDILLIFIIMNLVCYTVFKDRFIPVVYLLFSFSILNPLFLYMSKGSFFPSILFFIISIIIYSNIIKKHLGKTFIVLLISSILFALSTYEVYGNFTFDKDAKPVEELSLLDPSTFSSTYKSLSETKNTTDIFASLYIVDNRLFSTENLLNWRLQIWQDVIDDLIDENKLIFGYGYNEIIPAMDNVDRRGTDGTNENVHNYLINILARGGVFQVFLILYIFYTVGKRSSFDLKFINFVIAIFLVSSFDPSMETVRFPVIFYAYLTMFFVKNNHIYNRTSIES